MKKEKEDIPKNILILMLMIVIIVSITGTWMVLDKVSNTEQMIQNKYVGSAEGNIALDIEYDQKNQTNTENRVLTKP